MAENYRELYEAACKREHRLLECLADAFDLRERISEDVDLIEVEHYTDGHSGPGWYVWHGEYRDEGSELLFPPAPPPDITPREEPRRVCNAESPVGHHCVCDLGHPPPHEDKHGNRWVDPAPAPSRAQGDAPYCCPNCSGPADSRSVTAQGIWATCLSPACSKTFQVCAAPSGPREGT